MKILHLEPTDVCQLACPLCPRETDPHFDKNLRNHLTISQIVNIFDNEFIKNLDKMFMCGNYGDPAAGKHTLEIYEYFKSINPNITLGMNTNGGLQNTDWWKKLASIFNNSLDYVVFSIDGLENTNHLYRRNSVWDKIITNVEAFITAGGSAHWDMLVYKHNQHQVDECIELAKTLGFKWFRAKVSKRAFIDGLEFPDGWKDPVQTRGKISCMALNECSIYMDATGKVSPCCWLGVKQQTPMLFSKIQDSWDTDNPHPICKSTCSSPSNSFYNQWQRTIQLK